EPHDPFAHLLWGEPVVAREPGVALEIDHARQGEAVVGPAAAVVEEELHLLLRPAGVGAGEVVSAAHEPGVAGAVGLVADDRAAVRAPLVGLDVVVARAEGGLGLPVHFPRPAGAVLSVGACGRAAGAARAAVAVPRAAAPSTPPLMSD